MNILLSHIDLWLEITKYIEWNDLYNLLVLSKQIYKILLSKRFLKSYYNFIELNENFINHSIIQKHIYYESIKRDLENASYSCSFVICGKGSQTYCPGIFDIDWKEGVLIYSDIRFGRQGTFTCDIKKSKNFVHDLLMFINNEDTCLSCYWCKNKHDYIYLYFDKNSIDLYSKPYLKKYCYNSILNQNCINLCTLQWLYNKKV